MTNSSASSVGLVTRGPRSRPSASSSAPGSAHGGITVGEDIATVDVGGGSPDAVFVPDAAVRSKQTGEPCRGN